MSMRSALWLPVFVLAIALLILIVSFGAILAIVSRNRRPGFSYFAGIKTTPKLFQTPSTVALHRERIIPIDDSARLHVIDRQSLDAMLFGYGCDALDVTPQLRLPNPEQQKGGPEAAPSPSHLERVAAAGGFADFAVQSGPKSSRQGDATHHASGKAVMPITVRETKKAARKKGGAQAAPKPLAGSTRPYAARITLAERSKNEKAPPRGGRNAERGHAPGRSVRSDSPIRT
jgi:hypothetical protein